MQGPTHVVFDFAKLPCSAVPDTPRTQHKGWEGAEHKPPVPALVLGICMLELLEHTLS